jgi:hypothetical protein
VGAVLEALYSNHYRVPDHQLRRALGPLKPVTGPQVIVRRQPASPQVIPVPSSHLGRTAWQTKASAGYVPHIEHLLLMPGHARLSKTRRGHRLLSIVTASRSSRYQRRALGAAPPAVSTCEWLPPIYPDGMGTLPTDSVPAA